MVMVAVFLCGYNGYPLDIQHNELENHHVLAGKIH